MRQQKLSLRRLMATELPNISSQKRLCFRPPQLQIDQIYKLLNTEIFNNSLKKPNIQVAARCRTYWGCCCGNDKKLDTGINCELRIMDKWYCIQWMITILAHEMVHQHQWDVSGPKRESNGQDSIMSHGPSFFQYKRKLSRYNIPLKVAYDQDLWFKTQDIRKC